MATQFSLILQQKKSLARDIIELRFTKPAGFTFIPGQFIQFMVPTPDGLIPRSYSIASTPDDANLVIVLKVMPTGKASAMFVTMNPGETVVCRGPFGRFTSASHVGDKVLISTSTGLAPFMPMIMSSELGVQGSEKKDSKIFLLAGFRSEADIFYQDKLEELKKQNPNFDFAITLSQPSSEWKGLRGRVTTQFEVNPNSEPTTQYYLCGNGTMITEMTSLLTAKNIAKEQIHFEVFF